MNDVWLTLAVGNDVTPLFRLVASQLDASDARGERVSIVTAKLNDGSHVHVTRVLGAVRRRRNVGAPVLCSGGDIQS